MNSAQIMLLVVTRSMGFKLEQLERKNFKLFKSVICILALLFNFFSSDSDLKVHNDIPNFSPSQELILKVRSGSEDIVIIESSLGKRKKINMVTHRRLEKFFPDWEERIAYQKGREKVYKAAMRKRREALRLRQKEDFNRTKGEQDSIDYFSGRGVYQTHQDPSVKPNIFDNRQSFLIKVHNKEMRMNFLKSFNKRHDLIP